MAKGTFDQRLKDYYGAECGGYTSITATEINKQTYNIKQCIRDILIEKLGRENIPKHNEKTPIKFKLSGSLFGTYGAEASILCKFNKPSGSEMAIYLSHAGFISKDKQNPGDIWCIYFKEGNPLPWFDYVKKEHWEYILNPQLGNDLVEPDEITMEPEGKKISTLTYAHPVTELQITEVTPPERLQSYTGTSQSATRVVTTEAMKRIHENQKIKGNRGEEIVVRIEKERLTAAGRSDLADKVRWVSKDYDGYGYDIESFDFVSETSAWKPVFIEVKTTSQPNRMTPFYVSENEKRVSEEKGSSYYLYRLFAMTAGAGAVSYYRVNGSLAEKFDLTPYSYIARVK